MACEEGNIAGVPGGAMMKLSSRILTRSGKREPERVVGFN